MPVIPPISTVTETGFESAFRRVQQSDDFDCSFAVIAMICGTTLEAVRNVAIERFHHPAHGPYWITGALVANLLEHYWYETGTYEEPASMGDIPDLAIAVVDSDDHINLGRHILFRRAHASYDERTVISYVMTWRTGSRHRTTCERTYPRFSGISAFVS